MEEMKNIQIPVPKSIYVLFRIKAAENDLTIAGFGRVLVEAAIDMPAKNTYTNSNGTAKEALGL